MGVWQGLFIILGCLVAGLLVGLLVIHLVGRKKSSEYSLFDKETNFIKTAGPGVAADATVSSEKAKSNGHEDLLAELIKNHKNNITAEKPAPPVVTNVPVSTATAAPKNPPVIAQAEKPAQPVAANVPVNAATTAPQNPPVIVKAEKPAQPVAANVPVNAATAAPQPPQVIAKEEKPPQRVMRWTDLYANSSQVERDDNEKPLEASVVEAPVEKEPVAVNQKGSVLEEKAEKTAAPGIIGEAEIITEKAAPAAKKPKKAAAASGHKKSETVIKKDTPEVKDKNADTKPLVQEADINAPQVEPAAAKPEDALKSELIMEMEANLTIAGKPWENKLFSFQTKCWDSKHGESDLFLNAHYQEMIQLYVDIGLANNIVWLAAEINHRSKELDESYIKLCSSIAANIKKILS